MSDQITIDDFTKIDLRVGLVLKAERHPDPKVTKLLVLSVDLGETSPRTILAGIAQHYTPDEMLGKKIVVVANLAPREMRGITSHGMLLAAGDGGKPSLLMAEASPGTRVG